MAPSPFIHGIHEYCDRRCERCAFRSRCSAHVEGRLTGGGASAGVNDGARRTGGRADALLASAEDYAQLAWPIARALRSLALDRGDPLVIDAVETIAALSVVVASKIARAIAGLHASSPGPSPSDANGSAKVARLAIAESRQAWSVMMEDGRATANGVPAKLVAELDGLDRQLAERFPHAMMFVRPGFDTEPPDDDAGDDPGLLLTPHLG